MLLCNKKFTITSNFKAHTGEKPYVCNFCNKTFSQSGNVATHIKVKHPEQEALTKKVQIIILSNNGISSGAVPSLPNNIQNDLPHKNFNNQLPLFYALPRTAQQPHNNAQTPPPFIPRLPDTVTNNNDSNDSFADELLKGIDTWCASKQS